MTAATEMSAPCATLDSGNTQEEVTMADSSRTTSGTDVPQFRYDAKMAGEIEKKWQGIWARDGVFNADNPTGDLAGTRA